MAKIPFGIKYRPLIESGEYKVETVKGFPVEILKYDAKHKYAPIIFSYIDDTGEYTAQTNGKDLFIVTPEEELTDFEIRLLDWLSNDTSGEIPMERMKELSRNRAKELLSLAREQFIKDGYVIEKKAFHDAVERVSPEVMKEVSENIDNEITQLTEFERAFDQFAEAYHSDSNPDDVACCKEYATKLLSIAEKELSAKYRFSSDLNGFAYGKGYEDGKKEAEEDMKEALRTEYEKGRADALKDLPRWKKATGKERFNERMIVIAFDNDLLCTNYAEEGEYYISFPDLEKLPKED